MRLRVLAFSLLLGPLAHANPTPTITRYEELVVMTPNPNGPLDFGLRLRTMTRGADHLWVGPTIPAYVRPEIGHLDLSLLDARPQGGWVATYRETYASCGFTGKNCSTMVKLIDPSTNETWSVMLDGFLSRKDHLEVQDVRYAEDTHTLYYNEACQSYSKEAGGRCSSLVAFDPVLQKVLWRTPSLVSNNQFILVGDYIITAYGFTDERSNVHVVRRRDGAILDRHPLAGSNFEMFETNDHLRIVLPTNYGDANFTLTGFDGPTPKLLVLPNTPSVLKSRPYDPPLVPRPNMLPPPSPIPHVPLPPSQPPF